MGEEFNGVLYVGGKRYTNVSLENVTSFSDEINEGYLIKAFQDVELSFTCSPCWTSEVLYPDLLNGNPEYNVPYLAFEQARKHKKKRINKKWRKRYGFVYRLKNTKGWEVEFGSDGTIRFVKNLGETK